MLDFCIKKEELLAPLLTVFGAVEKRHSLVILSHFLFKYSCNQLTISATDLEIEISAQIPCEATPETASITVPAKKIIDIVRSFDDDSTIQFSFTSGVVNIKQSQSSFKLTTLPAENYPARESAPNEIELTIPRMALLQLFQSTHFAMADQDVRIFLNGLLLEFEPHTISTVATDGHRMAISRHVCTDSNTMKLLLPKKGIQELVKLLTLSSDETVLLTAGKSHCSVITKQFEFLTKLIEARFPPYQKAIPTQQDKFLIIDCVQLKRSLSRATILAHEKSKAVILHVQPGQLTLIANNNDQDEAIESLQAETEGEEIRIGLNAHYLLDVLNYIGQGLVRISMLNEDTSILIEPLNNESYQYIIMPMKI